MSALLLARRYLGHHTRRTVLLVVALGAMMLLPLTVQRLVTAYGRALAARADATPLLVGALGSRYDLVLNTLYFTGRVPTPTDHAELERLLGGEPSDGELGRAIPLLSRRTAAGWPVVGTSHDYFAFRDLRAESGELPIWLGEAALGHAVARELGLGVGDTLLSDRGGLYDLAATAPLVLKVTGVLAESGSPDDRAIFVDVRTAWILEGLGHGHAEELAQDELLASERGNDGRVVDTANASLVEATEITPENVGTFHFHDNEERLPLTGIVVVPKDTKSATLLKGRYRVAEEAQVLVPREVTDELLGFVFRAKTFFDANAAVVGMATGLLLALLVLLDLRARQRELETMRRIGVARAAVLRIVACELLIVLGLAGTLAWLGSLGASVVAVRALGLPHATAGPSTAQPATPNAAPARSPAAPLELYTTFYPTTYFAQRIGGDEVHVTCPLPEDADPARWQPPRDILRAYQAADLAIVNGAQFEDWVAGVSLPLAKRVDTAQPFRAEWVHYEDARTHQHGPDGAHTHSGVDGHTWVDPLRARQQAAAVRDALMRVRPESAEAFEAGYAALARDLEELEASLRELTPRLANEVLLASHPAYNYLAQRLGWNIVNLDLDPEEVPSDAQLAEARAALGGHRALVLLWEGDPIPAARERVREVLGVESVLFSPCEALSHVQQEAGESYLSVMHANVERLAQLLDPERAGD